MSESLAMIVWTIIDWSAGEVLIHIIICFLFLKSLLDGLVRWNFRVCDNRFCSFKTSFPIYAIFMSCFEISHEEITLRVDFNQIQGQIVRFLLCECKHALVLNKLCIKCSLDTFL